MQRQCLDVPSASKCGGQGGCTGNAFRPEVIPSRLNNITLYLQVLAVPARRNVNDPDVKRGEQLFGQSRCSACHAPELKTERRRRCQPRPTSRFILIPICCCTTWAKSSRIGRPDFKANGREWRTPPLWGVGLLRTVSGQSDLLHDGRARNVTEAILWHGGQAEKSREAFRTMSKADREALVRFVESL